MQDVHIFLSKKEYKSAMIEKLLIATSNPAKLDHYYQVLSDLVAQTVGLADLNIKTKPEETGLTAQENSEIKATYYSRLSGLPSLSIDEALYTDFTTDSQPGVYVRRINGCDDVSDQELFDYWLQKISAAPVCSRQGFWRFAYTLADQGQVIKTVIQDRPIQFYCPSSKNIITGWPLSSLQGVGRPQSEYTPAEKQKLIDTDATFVRQLFLVR